MKRPRILMFMLGVALIAGEAVGMEGGKDLGIIAAPGKAPAGGAMTLCAGEQLPFRVAEAATGGGSGVTAPPAGRSTIPKGARVPARSPLVLGTSDWYAWLNKMPPGPVSFHLTGTVTVPSPGHDARLVVSVPQGSDPSELKLDLRVTKRPGTWPPQATKVAVRYDESTPAISYRKVRIQWPGGTPVSLQVEEVH